MQVISIFSSILAHLMMLLYLPPIDGPEVCFAPLPFQCTRTTHDVNIVQYHNEISFLLLNQEVLTINQPWETRTSCYYHLGENKIARPVCIRPT